MPQGNPLNLFDAFQETAERYPSKTAAYFKKGASYLPLTYRELYRQSLCISEYLLIQGFKKNDHVAVILDNGPLWPVSFFALMRFGAVAVPVYPQLETQELDFLLAHSDSLLIVTSSATEARAKNSARNLKIPVLNLESIPQDTAGPGAENKTSREEVSCDDIALIVYTSGTTDTPKGVMLSHKNLLANVRALSQTHLLRTQDCFPVILPLHHTYPFMVTLLLPLLNGATISFVTNLEADEFFSCIAQTSTNGIAAVPRVFNLFYEKINAALAKKPFLQRSLLEAALRSIRILPRASRVSLTKLLLKDLHKKFGASFRLMISGGAKLNIKVARAFDSWGFMLLEGYGLTETSPVVSFNTPRHWRLGSAGKPLQNIEIKIDSADAQGVGEIAIKGESVTPGYYNDREYSQKVLRDGWLFTQDLGYLDKDGFLYITGRKNETIVFTSGQKINPEELESYYKKSPFIKEICIFTSSSMQQKDVLAAVVVPDLEYFRRQGLSQTKDRIRWEIETLSGNLLSYKRLAQFTLANEELPKTLLGKLKRFEVEKKFAAASEDARGQGADKKLTEEDTLLLASPICQKVLEYLSQKAKKKVYPANHLELDLGLDSLERISLFFEFQKITGKNLDERPFFYVSTVRDVLLALYAATGEELSASPAASGWKEILNAPFEQELQKTVVLNQGALSKLVKLIIAAIVAAITRTYFALRVQGKNNLPAKGPFILAPNHTSFLDPFFVGISLPLPTLFNTYFLGYHGYLGSPLISWAKNILQFIAIDTGMELDKSLRLCSNVLHNGKNLCIFPEGIRSQDGAIQEFKRGVGILVEELDIPVIPVYIQGAFRAWPAHKAFPRAARVKVTFGKPLTLEELTRVKKDSIDIYQNIAHTLRNELVKLANL